MKTKQEMESRSVYMPKIYWRAIDDEAEREDSSSNQVIRKAIRNMFDPEKSLVHSMYRNKGMLKYLKGFRIKPNIKKIVSERIEEIKTGKIKKILKPEKKLPTRR